MFYYKGKFRNGWINITNPFRGTWVLGTPGSGKTFSIIEPFIRQHDCQSTFCTRRWWQFRLWKWSELCEKGLESILKQLDSGNICEFTLS